MKAAEIFDVCHGRYRSLHDWLADSSGSVRSLGLRRPEWKGRLKLFEIYFLGSFEYRTAIRLVGVAEGTFDYWYREVKRALGAEFSRTGLYPPSRYFCVVRGKR